MTNINDDVISNSDFEYVKRQFKEMKFTEEEADKFIQKYGSRARSILEYTLMEPTFAAKNLNIELVLSKDIMNYLLEVENIDVGMIIANYNKTRYNAKTSRPYKNNNVSTNDIANYKLDNNTLEYLRSSTHTGEPFFSDAEIYELENNINAKINEYINSPEIQKKIEAELTSNVNKKNDISKVDAVNEARKRDYLSKFPKIDRNELNPDGSKKYPTDEDYREALKHQYIEMKNKQYEYAYQQSALSGHAASRYFKNIERKEYIVETPPAKRNEALNKRMVPRFVANSEETSFGATKGRLPNDNKTYEDCAASGSMFISHATSTNMGSFGNNNLITGNTYCNQGVGHHEGVYEKYEKEMGIECTNFDKTGRNAQNSDITLLQAIQSEKMKAGDVFSVWTGGKISVNSSGHHFLTLSEVKKDEAGKVISYTLVDNNGGDAKTRVMVCTPQDSYSDKKIVYASYSTIKTVEFTNEANTATIEELEKMVDITRDEVAGKDGLLDKLANAEKEVLFSTDWTKYCDPSRIKHVEKIQRDYKRDYFAQHNEEIRESNRTQVTEKYKNEISPNIARRLIFTTCNQKLHEDSEILRQKNFWNSINNNIPSPDDIKISTLMSIKTRDTMTSKELEKLTQDFEKSIKDNKKTASSEKYKNDMDIVQDLKKDIEDRKKIEKILDKIISGKASQQEINNLLINVDDIHVFIVYANNYFNQEKKKPNKKELNNWSSFIEMANDSNKSDLKQSMLLSAKNSATVFDKTKSSFTNYDVDKNLPTELLEAYNYSIKQLTDLLETYNKPQEGAVKVVMLSDKTNKDNVAIPTSISEIIDNNKKLQGENTVSRPLNRRDMEKLP